MFLKISQKSQGSTCAKVSFFNKVAGQLKIKVRMIATLFKKRLCRRCFPVNFAKFLRASLLQNTSERLLLTGFLRFFRKKERENGWLLLKRGKRAKLFIDEVSVLSVIDNINLSVNNLNSDFIKFQLSYEANIYCLLYRRICWIQHRNWTHMEDWKGRLLLIEVKEIRCLCVNS